jgi:hypothetical protein
MSDKERAMAATRKSAAVRTKRRDQVLSRPAPDEALQAKLEIARRALEHRGILLGAQSKRLSVRVDPGLVEEAKRRSGVRGDSELVNAALALMAGGDNFGTWLVGQKGRLSDDFELAI